MDMEMILTDVQILATLICAVFSFIAWKMRSPPIAIVPAIGFCYLGLQIYDASGDLMILGLYYFTASVQFLLSFGSSGSRRR